MTNKDYDYYLKMWDVYINHAYNSDDLSNSPRNGLESVYGFITISHYDNSNLNADLANELTDKEFVNRFLAPNNTNIKSIDTGNWFIKRSGSYILDMQECIASITQWQMMHDEIKDPQPLAISMDLIAVALNHNTRIDKKTFFYWKNKLDEGLYDPRTIKSLNNYSPKLTHSKTILTNERQNAVKESILEYLDNKVSSNKVSIATLQQKIVPILKDKGWVFVERGIDANEKISTNKQCFAISKLTHDIYDIFQTKWWLEQENSTRKKVNYTPRKQKK